MRLPVYLLSLVLYSSVAINIHVVRIARSLVYHLNYSDSVVIVGADAASLWSDREGRFQEVVQI